MAHILIDQKLEKKLFKDQKQLITPKELKALLPVTIENNNFILDSRSSINNILQRKDPRLLLVVGPCSIHDPAAAFEYGLKLKALAQKVNNNIFLAMRVYFAKPRTTIGWQGYINDPLLNKSNKINYGLYYARELLKNLNNIKLPLATEFLDNITAPYLIDLISWLAVGARTVESQLHRNFVSTLSLPVGFKNATSGYIDSAIAAVWSASQANNILLTVDDDGRAIVLNSHGNPNTHIILRGGDLTGPNYNSDNIIATITKLKNINNSEIHHSVMIDCSHGNSGKDYNNQKIVFKNILQQLTQSHGKYINGIMLESFLKSGKQALDKPLEKLEYGLSITDPCLSFTETEDLIFELNDYLSQ